jgi:hypothetical protein
MTDADRLPESADFAAYLRALPQLLKNGDGGRVALIREGHVVSVWDTAADALQAGHDRFGSDADFLTQPISPKDLDAPAVGRPAARRSGRRPARP